MRIVKQGVLWYYI